MDKNSVAPIAEAMQKYSEDGALAFHTPGHKQGLGAHKLLKRLVTAEGLRQEVSLMDELDDLHSPRSCIREAENFAARLWHANDCLFMINGTTAAIQSMILATLHADDLVFVPRNSHRSVLSGLILSGAVPIFLPVDFSTELNVPLNLTPATLAQAIKKFPQAKALILTSPNYYGVAADSQKMAEMLHAAGMKLLVDEAHGAHLQFSGKLPLSAMDAGADFAAQSTHKILGSMTQTSMILVRGDSSKVRRVASLLQSTSPNYLLLASLDIARLQIAQDSNKIAAAVELSNKIRAEINSIGGLKSFGAVKNFALDLTKITVNVSNLGLTGIEAEKILRHDLKIQCELSDAANLLFLITYADTCASASKLVEALRKLPEYKKNSAPIKFTALPAEITSAAMPPRQAFFAESEAVPLEKCAGKICAEEVTFYPPGIPILNLGEIVTPEIVSCIREQKSIGGRIIGAADTELNTLKVCRTDSEFRQQITGGVETINFKKQINS